MSAPPPISPQGWKHGNGVLTATVPVRVTVVITTWKVKPRAETQE